MRIVTLITSLLGSVLLVSCSRSSSGGPPTGERSVEQRVADLEQHLKANAPKLSEAEGRKQYEHDLAEIQSMGLVERAQRDIGSRLTNATVEKWTIGYFMHTNTVWCNVGYRLPGGSETLQQEFGYTRKTGTNWSLIWGVGAQPE
jgi:hypothetical protein